MEFRLFIEELGKGRFRGPAIDWDGFHSGGKTALVPGFISGRYISFTKEYPEYQTMDEWGQVEKHEGFPGHEVVCEGWFDQQTRDFTGTWQVVYRLAYLPGYRVEEVPSGTWRRHRCG